MNEGIGENLQAWAKILGVICLIIGGIAAISLWVNTEEFLPGFYALLGSVGGYVSCCALYGFGYLIEEIRGLNTTTDSIIFALKKEKKDK